MKKILLIAVGMVFIGACFVCFHQLSTTDKTTNEEIVKLHQENLAKSPFKETLELTKEERKALGLPPNKYYESEWELTMHPVLGRPTPENLKNIQESRVQNRVPGDGIANSWVSRGPDNVGGRTRAVMFDPNDPTQETVFAGGVSGGLWKNTNISFANSVWILVDIPSNLSVSCITYDPNDPAVFYIGTGESYVSGDVNGDGVWKSEDAGLTWTKIFGGISGPTTFESASDITVNSPAGIAGDYLSYPTTAFGTQITSVITADLILANDATGVPSLACNAFGEDATGKIAVIRRGTCNFDDKVKNAENAGALGVIMLNNIDGTPIPMGGDDTTIMIPSVMISKADGDLLEAAMAAGTVNGSLNPSSGTFTGNLVPGIQHINDIKIRDNAGVSELYVAAGESVYRSANATTFLGGPEFGVYKSVDGGANFTEVSLPLTANGNKHEPNDIEIGADGTIWVSTIASSIFGDGGGKIFSSTDGTTFVDAFTVSGANRTQIAVSSQNPDKIYILAQISGGVTIQSTDDAFATGSTALALPNDADNGIPATDFTRGQAFYDLMLEVDPSNDQNVFTGGIDLFNSTNGGTAWTQISKWSNNNNLAGLNVPLVHADQHGLSFANGEPNRMVFGNDGGVYFSNDGGVSNLKRNNGFITTQFYTVGVAPTTAYADGDDHFLAGAQDNGTQLFDGVGPGINSSVEAFGGDGAHSFFDQDGTDQYYITNYVYNGIIILFNQSNNTQVTINNESGSNGDFINPEVLDSNLDILYTNYSTTSTGPIVRRYAGIKSTQTLTKTSLTDALLLSKPTAFAVSPYTTASTTLLVGTVLGDILKVENADTTPTWTDLEVANVIVGSVSDVEFGATENDILVTVHNYGVQSIWYTNDGGTTWTPKEGNLPDMPVKSILQSPLNPEEVIVGTELGVWFTEDFSAASPSWAPAFNGMSNVKVTDLDLRNDNAVYASTYGRGVFSGAFTLDAAGDIDGDGVLNGVDNCPSVANADQADSDGNGIGDVCQDTDNDSILDINDNCVDNSNIDQADSDNNGIGDACQDTDGDTIVDVDDNCIDTANTDQLDTNGNGNGDVCDTSYEAPDNITLEVVSESCDGQDNGTIEINVNETFVTYTLTVVGNGLNLSEQLGSTSYLFEDIAVGAYTVCVSVDGRDYEQCFEINVDAAEPLDGVFGLANDGSDDEDSSITTVIINSGTPPFTVLFNDEVVRVTSENSFEVETYGSGLLEVKSAKACEGVMRTNIIDVQGFEFIASPNPVIENLRITLPSIEEDLIPIQIYTVAGRLVLDTTISRNGTNFIQIPFGKLNKGIYFVKLRTEKPVVFKIIKK